MPLPPPMTDDLPPPNSREHTVRRWRWGGQASFREHTVRRWRWGLASFAAAAGCDSLSGELQTAPNAVGDFIATGPRTPESNEADRTPPGTRSVSLVFFPNRERAIVLLASFLSFVCVCPGVQVVNTAAAILPPLASSSCESRWTSTPSPPPWPFSRGGRDCADDGNLTLY